MPKRIGRRAVIRSVTGAAIGLPWLYAMGCGTSGGGAESRRDALNGVPRRLLVFIVPNGTDQTHFFPSEIRAPTDYDLGLCMQTTELSSSAAPTTTIEELKDKVTILDGIDSLAGTVSGGEHQGGAVTLLTGRRMAEGNTSTGPSFDRVLEGHLRETDPSAPADLVLTLGTGSLGWSGQLSYTSAGTRASKVNGPRALFERLFAAREEPDMAALRRARRASILDGALDSYHRLRARLGGEDRQRVEDHLTQLREVELRLQASARSCSPPGEAPAQYYDSTHLPEILDAYRALLPLAFACDLTRVVTLLVRSEGANNASVFPWLSFFDSCPVEEGALCVDRDQGAAGRSHHAMSHHYTRQEGRPGVRPAPGVRRDYLEVQQWHVGKYAELVGELDALREGDGSLLDQMSCVYTSPLGFGNHHTRRLPMMVAGRLGGAIRNGVAHRLEPRRSVNDVWLTLMQGLGMDVDRFGAPEFSEGPISELQA